MADLKYEITEYLGVIKEKKGGWKKELNLVSWAGKAPKYDVRDWSEDHQKMSKGVTLTEEELLGLYSLIGELFFSGSDNTDRSETALTAPLNSEQKEMIDESADAESESSQETHDYGDVFLEELTRLEKELTDIGITSDDNTDDGQCLSEDDTISKGDEKAEEIRIIPADIQAIEETQADRKLEKAFRKKYQLIKRILSEEDKHDWHTVNDICEMISDEFSKEPEWELFQTVKIILSNASWIENRSTYYRWMPKQFKNVRCPKCGRYIIEKRGRKSGIVFYGCSGYPECDVSYWDKPTGDICPDCGSMVVEIKGRNGAVRCSNPECKFNGKK